MKNRGISKMPAMDADVGSKYSNRWTKYNSPSTAELENAEAKCVSVKKRLDDAYAEYDWVLAEIYQITSAPDSEIRRMIRGAQLKLAAASKIAVELRTCEYNRLSMLQSMKLASTKKGGR